MHCLFLILAVGLLDIEGGSIMICKLITFVCFVAAMHNLVVDLINKKKQKKDQTSQLRCNVGQARTYSTN